MLAASSTVRGQVRYGNRKDRKGPVPGYRSNWPGLTVWLAGGT